MASLYVVGTPIGNLEDITFRALRILREADFILSEDTRVTKKLLNHYEVDTPTISFHEHSDDSKYEKIIELLSNGKNLALVTDAGMPAISDPGSFLVKRIRTEMPDVDIRVIPGPSALTSAISVAGLGSTDFYFSGFSPHKKGRQTFFKKIAERIGWGETCVFFESTHRIVRAMKSLMEMSPDCNIVLAKELTKIHENILIGKPKQILSDFEKDPTKIKGEFVVIVRAE